MGEEVAVSPWVEIIQERIDLFAKATEDFQWIHVDRERAMLSRVGRSIRSMTFPKRPSRRGPR